uniref:NADH dehydrogenase subunit 6 n=1 Tax=Diurodrilus subterraneus TaxID=1318637 RepID=M9W977_9ANNE|nr:NADH dehydrogenase subunit 6 [Diurodrilus subterraneus]
MSLLPFIYISVSASFMLSAPLISSPMTLSLLILSLAMGLVLISSSIMSVWGPLIIFLIYAGVMMVMFSYFAVTTPNQIHLPHFMYLICSFSPLVLLFMMDMNMTLPFSTHQTLAVYPLTSYLNISLYLYLALILLLAMIGVVKILTPPFSNFRPFL